MYFFIITTQLTWIGWCWLHIVHVFHHIWPSTALQCASLTYWPCLDGISFHSAESSMHSVTGKRDSHLGVAYCQSCETRHSRKCNHSGRFTHNYCGAEKKHLAMCVYVCVCACVHVCVRAYVRACVRVRLRVRVRAHVCVSACVLACVGVNLYTQGHTPLPWWRKYYR